MLDRLITWNEVIASVPFSRMHIWRLIKAGEFPAPIQVGKVKVAFRESEVEAWLDSKTERSAAYAPSGAEG